MSALARDQPGVTRPFGVAQPPRRPVNEVPCPHCNYLFHGENLAWMHQGNRFSCPRCGQTLLFIPPVELVATPNFPLVIARYITMDSDVPAVDEMSDRIMRVLHGIAEMPEPGTKRRLVTSDAVTIAEGIRAALATVTVPARDSLLVRAFVQTLTSMGTGRTITHRASWPDGLFQALHQLAYHDMLSPGTVAAVHAVACNIVDRLDAVAPWARKFAEYVEARHPGILDIPPRFTLSLPMQPSRPAPEPTTRTTTMDPKPSTTTTPPETLANRVKTAAASAGSLLLAEGKAAAWQSIAEQAAKRTYAPFMARLKAAKVGPGALAVVRELLATRPGFALYSFTVGGGMSLVPRAQRDPYYARMASEMRTLGFRIAIGEVLDPVLDAFFTIFDDFRDQAPEDEA